jgi:putative FmdB family regulatory protein
MGMSNHGVSEIGCIVTPPCICREKRRCAIPTYDYKCESCGVIEIFHGMKEDDKNVCPKCDCPGLEKLISAGGAVLIGGREANQYADIKHARYWRDKNGIRHRVTDADGYTTSGTVNKQTATPEQIKERKKADAQEDKKKRLKLQKDRANAFNKNQGTDALNNL